MAEVKIELTADDKASPILNDIGKTGSSAFDQIKNSALEFFKGLVGFEVLKQGLSYIRQLATDAIDTASSFEQMEIMLTRLTGSAAGGKQAFDWIVEFAAKTPFEMQAVQDSFVKLQVAGLDPMSGKLKTLVDSIAAFGGGSQELQRASVAIQQMAGKGVVSMEELRQQLGEALPTAMKVMASELGMSMAELSDKVGKGALDAKTGLDALFRGLEKEYGGAAESMMNSWSGMVTQLSVLWKKFILEISESGAFDSLKSAATDLKKWLTDAFESGAVRQWASNISTAISGAITIIKGLGSAVAFAVSHLDAFAVAMGAVAIMNAPIVISGIASAFTALVPAIVAANTAFAKFLPVLAAIAGYELGKKIDEWVYKLTGIDLSGMNKPLQDTAAAIRDNAAAATDLNQKVSALGLDGINNINQFNATVKSGAAVYGEGAKQYIRAETEKQTASALTISSVKKDFTDMVKLHETAINQMIAKDKELYQIESAISQTRMSTADMVLQIEQKRMSASEKYYSTVDSLESKYKTAMQLSGSEKIKVLEEVQLGWTKMTDEVKVGENVVVSSAAAEYTAISKIKEIGGEILKSYDEQQQAVIDTKDAWNAVRENSLAAMEDIQRAIKDLPLDQEFKLSVDNAIDNARRIDSAISQVNATKEFNVEIAGALAAINQVQAKLDSVQDKTVTLTIETKLQASPAQPFSAGIKYVEDKLSSLPKQSEFTVKVDQSQVSGVASSLDAIMEKVDYFNGRMQSAALTDTFTKQLGPINAAASPYKQLQDFAGVSAFSGIQGGGGDIGSSAGSCGNGDSVYGGGGIDLMGLADQLSNIRNKRAYDIERNDIAWVWSNRLRENNAAASPYESLWGINMRSLYQKNQFEEEMRYLTLEKLKNPPIVSKAGIFKMPSGDIATSGLKDGNQINITMEVNINLEGNLDTSNIGKIDRELANMVSRRASELAVEIKKQLN